MTRAISFVMPVLNEAANLRAALVSIMRQELPKGFQSEVILALGPSTDDTDSIALSLQQEFGEGEIRLVRNPTGNTAEGLNLGLAEAIGEYIFRVDAHSELTPGYVSTAVEVLDQHPEVANVGGQMVAEGVLPFQQAVAWAYVSRFGLGGGKFHVGGQAGPVDTVYLGVFRADVLRDMKGFDPEFVRAQDWELNRRLREAGHTVYFDPRLKVIYRPRDNWQSLGRQFYKTGLWRGKISRPTLLETKARYLAAPLLVIASLLIWPAGFYFAAVVLIAVSANIEWPVRWRLMMVLPIMHFCWGFGFIVGAIAPDRVGSTPPPEH